MTRIRSEDIVYRLIEEIYNRTRAPVSLGDILREVERRNLGIKERTIRYALERLTDRGRIIRVGRRPIKVVPTRPGVGLEIYLETPRDTGIVTSDKEKEEWGMEPLAKSLISEMNKTEEFLEMVRDNAEAISEEDPVSALTGMTLWLQEEYNKLVYRYDTLAGRERTEASKDLEGIKRLILLYLGSVLSVPILRGRTDLFEGEESGDPEEVLCRSRTSPIALITPSRSAGEGMRGGMIVCRSLLPEILRRSIIGRRVVEERPLVRTRNIVYVSGQDTSYWPIRVEEIASSIGRSYEGPPLYLFAGILYRTWRSGRVIGPNGRTEVLNSWSIVPKPAELPVMSSRTAVSEGYVLPPNLLGLVPEGMIKKTAEAQMNVLEYNIMLQLLRPGSLDVMEYMSPPFKPPDIIFHDGRLYPYEHKLDDFSYYYPHGNIVRRSVSLFWEIVQKADHYRRRTSIVGVVKRVGVPSVLPVIAWILYRRGKIDRRTFLWAATRPYLEQRAVSALFSGLMKGYGGLPEGRTFRTFAVVRSLWSMDDKLLLAAARSATDPEDVEDPNFWLERASIGGSQGLREYAEREGLPSGSEEILADALAKSKVAIFYYCPPVKKLRDEISIPRTEVLLPYSDRDAWEKKVDSVLVDSTPPDPRGVRLIGYELYPVDSEKSERYLILPDHVYQAHHYSRIYDADLRGRYLNYLVQMVARILRRGH